jgi:hypothetical protein
MPGVVFCVAISWLAGWLAEEIGSLKGAGVFLFSGENVLLSGDDCGP